jgi:hypothetical protein
MCLELTKKTAAWAVAAAFLGLLLTAGCGESSRHQTIGLRIGPTDLGLPEGACAATGFVILEPRGTTGRFPLALAVARLKEMSGETAGDWQAVSLKEEQATWWNSLFNTVPAVREVIVMGERTAGPPATGISGLVGKAKRLNARLCLVYGLMGAEPEEAALIGALYDTLTGSAIARIQAQATSADFQPKRADAPNGDQRHIDPQYLAARKFDRQVRACVVELIRRDSQLAPEDKQPPPAAPAGEP